MKATTQESSPDARAVGMLRSMLKRFVAGDALGLDPMDGEEQILFAERVERNRLDALVWSLIPDGESAGTLPDAKLTAWRRAYEQSLIRNMGQLQHALDVCHRLESAAIPCIGTRGPFAGESLYGDIAVRYFTDIDLLIPAEARDSAWDIVTGMGFEFHHALMDREACVRHHLQWPFRHEGKGLSLDLHWAVDHPYKLQRLDYECIFRCSRMAQGSLGDWRRPSDRHELILAALHAEKECRLAGRFADDAALAAMAKDGRWRQLLDVALTARAHADLDWRTLDVEVTDWQVKPLVGAILDSSARLFGSSAPPPCLTAGVRARRGRKRPVRSDGRIAQKGTNRGLRVFGFRAACLNDVFRYVFPRSQFFSHRRGLSRAFYRSVHAVQATLRLTRGSIELARLHSRRSRGKGSEA